MHCAVADWNTRELTKDADEEELSRCCHEMIEFAVVRVASEDGDEKADGNEESRDQSS